MKSLSTIQTNSDKISHHGYHRFYDRYLHEFVHKQNLKMLELGYENGYSIELWKNYFEDVSIDSIDIIGNPNNPLVNHYFNVNQDDAEQLDQFVSHKNGYYDFIIDDASHVPSHQWNTFIRFIHTLKEGGIYIIEDIETSFWKESEIYGCRFNANTDTLMLKLPAIFHFVNSEFIPDKDLGTLDLSDLEIAALRQIESVTIAYNSLIFVKKDSRNSTYYRTHSEYRHRQNIDSNKPKPEPKKSFWQKFLS